MDKKSYTLSEMIDFVTRGEESSNVDSDEEEMIVVLPTIARTETKTTTVISQMTNTKDLHTIWLAIC